MSIHYTLQTIGPLLALQFSFQFKCVCIARSRCRFRSRGDRDEEITQEVTWKREQPDSKGNPSSSGWCWIVGVWIFILYSCGLVKENGTKRVEMMFHVRILSVEEHRTVFMIASAVLRRCETYEWVSGKRKFFQVTTWDIQTRRWAASRTEVSGWAFPFTEVQNTHGSWPSAFVVVVQHSRVKRRTVILFTLVCREFSEV